MIVTLLPFFLGANITANEGDWYYGPEVIYNATIDVTSEPVDPSENIVMINMIMKIKCRSKSESIMSCSFQNPRLLLTLLKPHGRSIIKDTEELGENGLGDDLFELKFDPNGLMEIVVSSYIIPSKLDMIKTLVGQLNFGTDMTKRSMDYFEKESLSEQCKTSYLMWLNSVDKSGIEKDEFRINPYELLVLPNSKSFSGEIGRIQKTRHIDDCSYPVNYFSDSWDSPRVNTTIETKLKSSISHMSVTANGLTSFTEIELLIGGKKNSTVATLTEKLTVSLDHIRPAKGPLPMIRDPKTASPIPTRWLHDDVNEKFEKNDFDSQPNS